MMRPSNRNTVRGKLPNYRLAACAPQNVKERGRQAEVRSVTELFPLDRAWGLGRNIVNDAVDAFNFVNDAVGDAGE